MKQPLRLAEGGRVDRARPITFRFDGRTYQGFAGDTLASALLANGVRVTGRSFKYHRPRGLMAAGFEEANTLIQLGDEPNLKATQIELFEGLDARAVNCSPSARWDFMAVTQLLKPLMPAGFYYKTFIAPSWHLYESTIRRAAGLGESPVDADPAIYDKRNASCDVLVVGAGESGLAAAREAAANGADVLLIDANGEFGAISNVRTLARTTVFGYYDHNHLVAVEHLRDGPARQRLWRIRAREVILATGAFERPLVFPNNDRPGVMLASAARRYLRDFGVIPGRRVVIATNNDTAFDVADALRAAGVEIAAVADLRKGLAPTNVQGAAGVKAVELHRIDEAGRALRGSRQIVQADALIVSGGWNPAVHLFSQSGGELRFDTVLQAFVPDRAVQACRCVGAAAGIFAQDVRPAPIWEVDVSSLGRTSAKSWVDLASDVTVADLKLALRENFRSVEHVKRYTTTGMMTDQGKTSNVNAIGIISGTLGVQPGGVGTTKFRPPFDPVTFGAIAGRRVGSFYRPLRRLAAHDAHVARGAKMEDYGGWLRPAYYALAGEHEHAAVKREILAVRNHVGLFDASPLGKILVSGPDAGEFLHRMYLNNIRTLAVGNCRYGVMLGEDGVVSDDGVCARLGEQSYLVGTTSGAATRIGDWMEEWLQGEWPELDVIVEPLTTQWSVMTIAGAKARDVLAKLGASIDLAPQAFPHMSVREGTLGTVPLRVMRVSFTGELSYEISVPSWYATGLMEALLDAGRDAEIGVIGVEAIMGLRIEKGFLHVGSETDGTTLPQDIGFASIIEKKREDFVGRRSTMTPDGRRTDRKQLVGLRPLDDAIVLPIGAHVVGAEFGKPPYRTQGYVTSSLMSPTLNRPVALAMVAGGRARLGEQVVVHDDGRSIAAKIVEPAAYDPQGARIRA